MQYEIQSFVKVGSQFISIYEPSLALPDPNYVEGYIHWRIGETVLLSKMQYDLVDQLWAYIINGIIVLESGGKYETYFPDQALRLAFTALKATQVEVVIGNRIYVVPHDSFISSLAHGGRDFFSKMKQLLPEGHATWCDYLCKISKLRS